MVALSLPLLRSSSLDHHFLASLPAEGARLVQEQEGPEADPRFTAQPYKNVP
jgi:hypothetical protein